MDALPYIDAIVKEYLLFRGFTNTAQALEADKAADRGCGFQADQISNLIFGRFIPQHESRDLVELLTFLNVHLFSRLGDELEDSAPKLELSVLRLHIVHALESDRADEVRQFFSAFGEQLSRGPSAAEWEPWFALAFLQKPQTHQNFQVFFTKPWKQLVEASFRNFLSKAIAELPLPAILRFNADRRQRQALLRRAEAAERELESLRAGLDRTSSGRKRSLNLDRSGSSHLPLGVTGRRPGGSWTDLIASETARNEWALPRSSAKLQPGREDDESQTMQGKAKEGGSAAELNEATTPTTASFKGLQVSGTGTPEPVATSFETSAHLSDSCDSDLAEEPGSSNFEWPEGSNLPSTSSPSKQPLASAFATDASTTLCNHSRPLHNAKREGSGTALAGEGIGVREELGSSGSRGVQDESRVDSVPTEQETLRGHDAAITDAIFAPDGRNIASASADGIVRIWAPHLIESCSDRAAVLLCGAPVHRLAWDTRADKVMLMGTEGKGIKAWHLDTKRMVAHMRPDPAFPNVADLACSPTDPSFLSSSVASGRDGREGRLSLWNLRAFRKVHSFQGDARLLSVCFSPDGKTVVATGDDGHIRIFDVNLSAPTATLDAGETAVGPTSVHFVGTEGSSFLTVSADGLLRAWDFAMLRGPTWTMDVSASSSPAGPQARQHRLAVAPGGKEAALTSNSGAAFVVKDLLGSHARLVRVAEHRAPVNAVAWHPRERTIVTGSMDRTIIVTRLLREVDP